MDPYSLYLHVPFCRHRCGYCDFNTVAGQEGRIPAYLAALKAEIAMVSHAAPERLRVHTIYYGGGTPSLVSAEDYRSLSDLIGSGFRVDEDAEISLEANPGTVTRAYLDGLRAAGFNRISFGMQSASPRDLALLQRQHDFFDVVAAVKAARQAGFRNLSLDLIFGLPGQPFERWQESLERALSLHPEHLSLYALTVEPGTPLYHWASRGLVDLPDDDLAADEYEWASDRLERAGYGQYEISNWARVGEDHELMACRHNLQYWRSLPYLGFGSGSHGCAAGYRTANVRGVAPYIDRLVNPGAEQPFPFSPANESHIRLDHRTEIEEWMMVGLRLTREGVSAASFQTRFGESLTSIFGSQIDRLVKLGLLEWPEDLPGRLRLTARGRLVGNQVFMQFVGEGEED